jgi:hypothetical protein
MSQPTHTELADLRTSIHAALATGLRKYSAIWWSKRWQNPCTPLTLCDSKSPMSDQDASGQRMLAGGHRNHADPGRRASSDAVTCGYAWKNERPLAVDGLVRQQPFAS